MLYFYMICCTDCIVSPVVCCLLLLQSVFGIQSYGMASQYGWNKPGFVHSQQPMPMANYGSTSGQPNASYCGGQSRFMQPGMGANAAGQCRPTSLSYNSQFNNMQNYPVGLHLSPTFKFRISASTSVFTTLLRLLILLLPASVYSVHRIFLHNMFASLSLSYKSLIN